MNKQAILGSLVQAWLNTPYRWGGDDPTGVDCSGLVQELYWSVGVMPEDIDRTAANQKEYWETRGRFYPTNMALPEGGIFGWSVFFSRPDSNNVTHIELCIDSEISLGARGDSKTHDIEDAKAKNAFVKMRPIRGRKNMKVVGFANPF